MAEQLRGRAPHTLSKEHQTKVHDSDKLREKNPNKMGPDAPKPKASAPKAKPTEEQEED